MSIVSGIWDGYFLNVNFPEIFCINSSSESLTTKCILTPYIAGEHVRGVLWSHDIRSFNSGFHLD